MWCVRAEFSGLAEESGMRMKGSWCEGARVGNYLE